MKKKKLSLMILGFVILGLLGTKAICAETYVKIGYVDASRVFNGCRETQKATQLLNEEVKERQKEIGTRKGELNKLQQELREQKVILSSKEKKKREKIIKQKQEELAEFAKKVKEELTKKEKALTKKIIEEIYEVIKTVGIEKGYSVILEKSSLLYGADDLDLTDEIIERLNEKKVEKGL